MLVPFSITGSSGFVFTMNWDWVFSNYGNVFLFCMEEMYWVWEQVVGRFTLAFLPRSPGSGVIGVVFVLFWLGWFVRCLFAVLFRCQAQRIWFSLAPAAILRPASKQYSAQVLWHLPCFGVWPESFLTWTSSNLKICRRQRSKKKCCFRCFCRNKLQIARYDSCSRWKPLHATILRFNLHSNWRKCNAAVYGPEYFFFAYVCRFEVSMGKRFVSCGEQMSSCFV